jgi:hypothetical protein
VDQTKPAISISFEGTISDGFLGEFARQATSIDGAMDALQELNRKFRLIIVTSNSPSKFPEISDWIIRNKGERHFTFELTNIKPVATYMIDKRAIKFDNWPQILQSLSY